MNEDSNSEKTSLPLKDINRTRELRQQRGEAELKKMEKSIKDVLSSLFGRKIVSLEEQVEIQSSSYFSYPGSYDMETYLTIGRKYNTDTFSIEMSLEIPDNKKVKGLLRSISLKIDRIDYYAQTPFYPDDLDKIQQRRIRVQLYLDQKRVADVWLTDPSKLPSFINSLITTHLPLKNKSD